MAWIKHIEIPEIFMLLYLNWPALYIFGVSYIMLKPYLYNIIQPAAINGSFGSFWYAEGEVQKDMIYIWRTTANLIPTYYTYIYITYEIWCFAKPQNIILYLYFMYLQNFKIYIAFPSYTFDVILAPDSQHGVSNFYFRRLLVSILFQSNLLV